MLFASASEFAYELMHQFNPDGSNFEGSLPYHFFTFEMLATTLLILENQSSQSLIRIFERCGSTMMQVKNFVPILTEKLRTRISSTIDFTENFIKGGKIFNVGDFDNGKFLKLNPSCNYRLADSFDNPTNFDYISDLIQHLKSNKGTALFGERKTRLLTGLGNSYEKKNLFSDFGIYIGRQKAYSFILRCGKIGQRGKGGHAHNDQLSVCVKIAGRDLLVDPGTFVYTSCPELRNKFRSAVSHNILVLKDKEQNVFATNNCDDLFWFKTDRAKGKLFAASDKSISGSHSAYGATCTRKINFTSTSIEGVDSLKSEEEKFILFHLAPEVEIADINAHSVVTRLNSKAVTFYSEDGDFSVDDYDYSPSYGKKETAKVITLKSSKVEILWKIAFSDNQ